MGEMPDKVTSKQACTCRCSTTLVCCLAVPFDTPGMSLLPRVFCEFAVVQFFFTGITIGFTAITLAENSRYV